MIAFGSLFAGIGGIDLGLERAGMRCVWQVEADAYRRDKLERRWPHVKHRGDIRLTTADDLFPVDLVAGGFPCQDISSAGKREGIGGRRSGLWGEMLRLVQALRPRWVLVENVRDLRVRGADVVLADLEAAGYTCWPLVVGAWAVGAPHARERVWIVGHAPRPRLEIGRDERGDPRAGLGGAPAQRAGELADADGAGLQGERCPAWRGDVPSGYESLRRGEWPARPGEPQHEWEPDRTVKSRVGRAPVGLSEKLALEAYGDAAVPLVVEVIGRAIIALDRDLPQP